MSSVGVFAGCTDNGDPCFTSECVCLTEDCVGGSNGSGGPSGSGGSNPPWLRLSWDGEARHPGAGLALDGVTTTSVQFSSGFDPITRATAELDLEDSQQTSIHASYRLRGTLAGSGTFSVRIGNVGDQLAIDVMSISRTMLGLDGVFVPDDAMLAFMTTRQEAEVLLLGVDADGEPRRLLDESLADSSGAALADYRITLPTSEGPAERSVTADSIGERTFSFTMVAAADRVDAEPLMRDDTAIVRQCFSLRSGPATVVESDWQLEARDASGALVGLPSPYVNCVDLDLSTDSVTVSAQAAKDPALVASVIVEGSRP